MIPAIILARGGSKRLLRKNILPFCGHPLVAWSIVQAKNCKYIDDVWVTTDDDEIAEIGEHYRARIIRRPDWPDADEISAARPTIHAINEIRHYYDFDIHVPILPTDPVWHPQDFDRFFERFYEIAEEYPLAERVIPLCKPREVLIYRILYHDSALPVLATKDYEYLTMGPSRPIEKTRVWYNTYTKGIKAKDCIDTDTIKDFDQHRGFMKQPQYYCIVNWYQAISIDDLETFEFAETLMEKYVLQGKGIEIYEEYAKKGRGAI